MESHLPSVLVTYVMPYKIIKNLIKSSGAGDENSQSIHRKEAKTESESGQKPSGGPIEES